MRAPIRSASNCHGTRLLWCSISVSRITSPARKNFRAPRLRDQIDALSRAASEHDLVRSLCPDEISDALPRFFIMLGRAGAQRVQTAMHVRIFVFVIMSDDVEHGSSASANWPRCRNKSADGRSRARAGSENPRAAPANRL